MFFVLFFEFMHVTLWPSIQFFFGSGLTAKKTAVSILFCSQIPSKQSRAESYQRFVPTTYPFLPLDLCIALAVVIFGWHTVHRLDHQSQRLSSLGHFA